MAKKKPTLADIRAQKGKYQYSKLHIESWDEIAACEAAGIDMLSVELKYVQDPRFRQVTPSTWAVVGRSLYDGEGTTDSFLRFGYDALRSGADAI